MSLLQIGRARLAHRDVEVEGAVIGRVLARVVRWIPTETLVVYGLLVIARPPRPDLTLLLTVAVTLAPTVVLFGAWTTGREVGVQLYGQVLMAVGASCLWSGTVPGNGYRELLAVQAHPVQAAWAMAALGALYGLVASAIEGRLPGRGGASRPLHAVTSSTSARPPS